MDPPLNQNDVQSLREEVLNKLSPKEKAVFLFVEHLLQVERDFKPEKEDQILTIGWKYGRTTSQIYEAALKGNIFMLPTPEGQQFASFSWTTGYDSTPERRAQFQSYEKFLEEFPSRGSSDIRILDRLGSIVFNANLGNLKGTESWWSAATDTIEYPIMVQNRDRTVIYRNPSHIEAFGDAAHA